VSFAIEYYSDNAIIATSSHPGPAHKAEAEALIGLIRHLTTGVQFARVLDPDGNEVKTLHMPKVTVAASAGIETQPKSKDYFTFAAQQVLFVRLYGGVPVTLAGGNPEIGERIVRNGQHIIDHYWR
jgi:hypothetical protein